MNELFCFNRSLSMKIGLILMFTLLLSACTKSAPPCDSGKTVDAVINTVSENLKKDLSGLSSGQPGMELTDDEWRLMRSGMIITVNNMRQVSFDETTDQYECAGVVSITGISGREEIPVTYTSMLSETGDHKISVSGL